MVIGVNGPFHTSFPLIKPDVSLNISSSAWLWREERMGVLECPHRDHCNEPSTTVPDSRQLERLCSPLGAVGWGRRLEPSCHIALALWAGGARRRARAGGAPPCA